MNKPKATASTRRTKVLLVDDHAMLREGLAGFLSRQIYLEICGEAGDAPEAMRQLLEHQPDFVIVDISLKSGHGIELVKQIHAHDESTMMLVLSMHDESLFAERLSVLGPWDILTRNSLGPESWMQFVPS